MFRQDAADAVKNQCSDLGYKSIITVPWDEVDTKYLSHLSDEEYIDVNWYSIYGEHIDLNHPETFNEKIQWMKLYYNNPLYNVVADKIAAKEHVAKLIGNEHIIPTIGVWDSFDEIDFEKLPDMFVLKCTHDSGSARAISSKSSINMTDLCKFFNARLSVDYYLKGREWCYKDLPRKIMAEPLIAPGRDLKDYKIHIFDGIPKLIQVDMGRFSDHKRNMYTPEWEYLPFSLLYPRDEKLIEPKPDCLDEMLDIAVKLAGDVPYVRVDLYQIDGKVYFGELTFFHGSGYEPFDPPEWNEIMGSWIKLPQQ